MPRLSTFTSAMGLALALFLVVDDAQGQPGGRGGDRGGGGFGGGPPGGFGGPGGGSRGGDYYSLLREEKVQEELKMTEEQVKKVEEMSEALSDQRRDLQRQSSEVSRNLRNQADRIAQQPTPPPPANNNATFGGFGGSDTFGAGTYTNQNQNAGPSQADIARNAARVAGQQAQNATQQAVDALQKKAESALTKVLTKAQLSRLVQLAIQRQGIKAVVERPEVKKALNVNPLQTTKIDGLINGTQQTQTAMFRSVLGNPGQNGQQGQRPSDEERREMFTKMRETAEKAQDSLEVAILGVLTPKQREGWKKIQGEEFDFEAMDEARRDRYRRGNDDDEDRGRGGPGGGPPGGPGAGAPPGGGANPATTGANATPAAGAPAVVAPRLGRPAPPPTP